MWLPKDERKTLLKYHSHIHNIDEPVCFNNLSERVYHATRNLIERRLILEIKEGGNEHNKYMATWLAGNSVSLNGFLSSSEEDVARQTAVLKFTLNGLDLADKYKSTWLFIKLWYEQYIKNHPIWLIVSFLGGIIVTLIMNWLLGD